MNNRNRGVATWLIVGTLALGIIVIVARARDSSVRRFPRIPFGEVATVGRPGKLVLRTALPAVPSSVRVYRVKPLASKKDALLKLFRSLPIASNPKTEQILRELERTPESSAQKEEPFGASVGGWSVDVWSGGQFTIDNDEIRDRPYDFENVPAAPTPEEARKAADAFLARIGPLPADVHFAKAGPGRMLTRGLGDKPGDFVVTELVVTYSAAIDGIPYGPVCVYVGAGPTVVSVTSYLRQVVPDEKVAILSPQEAFDKLRAGEGHMSEGSSARGSVTSIELVYWLGAPAKDLSYIMPVYAFKGEAVADGKRTESWKACVEAVRPEFLETKPLRE